ncbi:MAG: insulinase family protein [Candidatus Hydrogenedentes bacterium]|nr:insulinase family protein [Candidatus Hydrogenedentota bacterium]
MVIRRVFAAVVCAVVLFAASANAGYREIHKPNTADPMAVRIFELDNGLRVYLTEDHESPRFYAEIAVRAGSKNDPPETTGLAHYLEHLLFKGTENIGTTDYAAERSHIDRITELYEEHFRESDPEKRKAIYAEINRESQLAAQYAIPNELDKLYKTMGGTGLNAHTSVEETVYKVNLPSNRLEQWAAIESERFSSPVFRLFQPELEIVYEEKNRSMDNKEWGFWEAVASVLYKHHPYGQQTVLGSVEHLKKPSLVNIHNFYNTYYVPNNMAICISGDIDVDATMAIIERYFERWEPKKLPKAQHWREKPLRGPERLTVKYKGEPYVLLAFRTVAQDSRDADALELFDMVLSNASAGLIDLNLNQQQRVRSAGAYPEIQNDYGAQFLWGIPKDGQSLEDVERLLLEQVELVKQGKIEDWVVPAIILDYKKGLKAGLESDEARVKMMRSSFISHEEWDHTIAKIARMEKLTKQDVIRVAKKYFKGDYVAGYRVDEQQEVTRIEKPAIDKINIDPNRQSEFAKKILAMPVKEIEPVFVDPQKDYRVVELPGGSKLYHVSNPVNDLFSFTISVDVGNWEDNRFGIATGLLDKSGTARLSPADLKKEWYKLGASFGVGSGDQTTSLSISGIDENFEKTMALMAEALNSPTSDKAALDELIRITLVQREDAKKDAPVIANALSLYNKYGSESPMLRALPSENLKQLTAEELYALVKGLLGYKATVYYVGTLSPERVKEVFERSFPCNAPLADPPPYRHLSPRTPEHNEIYFFDKEMAQAQIRLEFGTGLVDENDFVGGQLYSNYFSGSMAGVVFQELREARALAYSAWAVYSRGERLGDMDLLMGTIGTQVDKAAEATTTFIDIMDNLPVSESRFAETRNSLISNYRASKLGFRQILPAVRTWEYLGLTGDPRKQRFEQIQASNMETMLGFYRERITGRPKMISVVGTKNKMDMEALSKAGTIREVALDEIFVK